ncbi:hypothetical protein A8990_14336 [Paenibacillus taihuensis]|uniref:Carbon monoxide dehydrogenase subunit G n=1 Tax=Paenibacillus taihuensis TaxID=1156355 RepID=A0A3D9QU87_9BACL|nr:SRPBCC domain-containing protein [Paenibacillus taihuensis]REE67331.1 hypothetical protein A8990_14336 [Paenibacillus taihuensis]
MEVTGSFMIEASREEVWSVLMDAESLAGCVPGVERLAVIDDKHYEAEMFVKVQFMTLRFQAAGELKDAVEAERMTVELRGKALALAGLFRNQLEVRLVHLGDKQTEVSYHMSLQMSGRLASLGSLLVKGTVTKSAAEFAENVKKRFERIST